MTDAITLSSALKLWREHGGSTYGPHVEHVSMKESDFLGFCIALASRPSAIVEEPTTVAADESIDHHAYRVAHIPEPSRSPQPHTGRAGVTEAAAKVADEYAKIWSRGRDEAAPIRVNVAKEIAAAIRALTVEPEAGEVK